MQIKNPDMPFIGYIKTQKLISYILRDESLSKQFKIAKKRYIIEFLFVLLDLLFHETLKLNITQLKLFTKDIMISRKKMIYLLKKYKKSFANINLIIKNNQMCFRSLDVKAF